MAARYHVPSGVEVEAEPGSHGRVLRNRLGIKRKTLMDRVEYQALVAAQTHYLHRIESSTRFTASMIRQMHRDWLGGIYELAGVYRTVEVSKGDMAWPPAMRVHANMEHFSHNILTQFTPCRFTDIEDVCHAMAVVHAELLLIHPFRDGNGRIARWIADLMAAQAGLPLPVYRFEGRGSQRVRAYYLTAVQQGYLQRYDSLATFFREALSAAFTA